MELPQQNIRKLDENESSTIRSLFVVSSFSQAVEELLLNSLDAGATQVEICVDAETLLISVTDNGRGIAPQDLQQRIGHQQCTSHIKNTRDVEILSTYGFRGEALNAITRLSLITIKSSSGSNGWYQKVMRGDHTLSFGACEGPVSCGTQVVVRDLFYSSPVRRKTHRPPVQMLKIKDLMQRIALIHPSKMFTLYDKGLGSTLLRRVPCKSILHSFLSLVGEDKRDLVKELSWSYQGLCISGILSLPTARCCHLSKEFQYLYLNKRPMPRLEEISTMINKCFAKCCAILDSTGQDISEQTCKNLRNKRGSVQYGQFPMYVLDIQCCYSKYDLLLDPEKTIVEFSDAHWLRACIAGFLMSYVAKFQRAGMESVLEELRFMFQECIKKVPQKSERKEFQGLKRQLESHTKNQAGLQQFDAERNRNVLAQKVVPLYGLKRDDHKTSCHNSTRDDALHTPKYLQCLTNTEHLEMSPRKKKPHLTNTVRAESFASTFFDESLNEFTDSNYQVERCNQWSVRISKPSSPCSSFEKKNHFLDTDGSLIFENSRADNFPFVSQPNFSYFCESGPPCSPQQCLSVQDEYQCLSRNLQPASVDWSIVGGDTISNTLRNQGCATTHNEYPENLCDKYDSLYLHQERIDLHEAGCHYFQPDDNNPLWDMAYQNADYALEQELHSWEDHSPNSLSEKYDAMFQQNMTGKVRPIQTMHHASQLSKEAPLPEMRADVSGVSSTGFAFSDVGIFAPVGDIEGDYGEPATYLTQTFQHAALQHGASLGYEDEKFTETQRHASTVSDRTLVFHGQNAECTSQEKIELLTIQKNSPNALCTKYDAVYAETGHAKEKATRHPIAIHHQNKEPGVYFVDISMEDQVFDQTCAFGEVQQEQRFPFADVHSVPRNHIAHVTDEELICDKEYNVRLPNSPSIFEVADCNEKQSRNDESMQRNARSNPQVVLEESETTEHTSPELTLACQGYSEQHESTLNQERLEEVVNNPDTISEVTTTSQPEATLTMPPPLDKNVVLPNASTSDASEMTNNSMSTEANLFNSSEKYPKTSHDQSKKDWASFFQKFAFKSAEERVCHTKGTRSKRNRNEDNPEEFPKLKASIENLEPTSHYTNDKRTTCQEENPTLLSCDSIPFPDLNSTICTKKTEKSGEVKKLPKPAQCFSILSSLTSNKSECVESSGENATALSKFKVVKGSTKYQILPSLRLSKINNLQRFKMTPIEGVDKNIPSNNGSEKETISEKAECNDNAVCDMPASTESDPVYVDNAVVSSVVQVEGRQVAFGEEKHATTSEDKAQIQLPFSSTETLEEHTLIMTEPCLYDISESQDIITTEPVESSQQKDNQQFSTISNGSTKCTTASILHERFSSASAAPIYDVSKYNQALMEPVNLTKEDLASAHVIGQADKKFILCRLGGRLLCFDQHAAHERVRLEALEAEVYGEDRTAKNVQNRAILPAATVYLTAGEADVAQMHSSLLESWGFKFKIDQSIQSSRLSLYSVPEICGVGLKPNDLKEFIQRLGTFGSGASLSAIAHPPSVQKILNSKACRGALMFGDELLRSECQELVSKLSKCNLAFQCAHGRPSVVPLLDLSCLKGKVVPQRDRNTAMKMGIRKKLKRNQDFIHHCLEESDKPNQL